MIDPLAEVMQEINNMQDNVKIQLDIIVDDIQAKSFGDQKIRVMAAVNALADEFGLPRYEYHVPVETGIMERLWSGETNSAKA